MNRHITSLHHPLLKHLIQLRKNHHYRYEQGSVVVEGIKPITEICKRCKAKLIIASDPTLISPEMQATETYITTDAVIKKVSGMVNSEGILAEFPLPINQCLKGMNFILILDTINDPGNLGTLLRTALALGWEGAFIVGDSCDPYNEKALRAARGACFSLPICQGSWDELYALVKANAMATFIADLNGANPHSIDVKQPIALILCNEARGPSPEALALGTAVSIPISTKMESLNVASAGAILMYLLQQRG
jgi:TrmH family RNA methyltransferase